MHIACICEENDVFYSAKHCSLCCDLLNLSTNEVSFEAPANTIISERRNLKFWLPLLVWCDLFTSALTLFTFFALVLVFQRVTC